MGVRTCRRTVLEAAAVAEGLWSDDPPSNGAALA